MERKISDDDPPRRRFLLFGRADVPIWLGLLVAVGVVAALVGLPEAWSVHSRVAAGVALGVGATIAVFANRMIGGSDF
jgi:hypothetical protein